MGTVHRWVTTRRLKTTSEALKRAERDLRVEREQVQSYRDDAADAQGAALGGNASDRDEAFRAGRHLDAARARVNSLELVATELRAKQDRLLDKFGNNPGGGSW